MSERREKSVVAEKRGDRPFARATNGAMRDTTDMLDIALAWRRSATFLASMSKP